MGKRNALVIALAAALLATGFQGPGDGFKRERGGDTAALKDSLEGKAPPAIAASEWANAGKAAPTWKDLKGKVVVLDFWAYW